MRKFFHDKAGSVAILFSVSLLAVFGLVGGAVDYSRMVSVKSDLSHAVDAAALAAARLQSGDRSQAALQVFSANYKNNTALRQFRAYLVATTPNEVFRVEATVDVPMTVAKAVGFSSFPVAAFSETVLGSDANLQIALSLDVTGSMSGNRMTAMKAAANDMVNTMFTSLTRPGQVKFSVVPFARYVNVGLENRKKPWMSVLDDYSETKNVCTTSRPVTSKTNCRMVTTTKYNDGVAYTSTTEQCDYTYGDPVTSCKDQTTTYKWRGCAGSRATPFDTLDSSYTTPIPGLMNTSCGAQLLPLSTDKAAIANKINSLVASDETYLPPGLLWGWRTLSPGEPFDDQAEPNKTTHRYLVLMTDGVNTLSPSYPRHTGTNRSVADKLTADVCRNAKAGGIVLYTVAFEVIDVGVKNMLRTCASNADMFFDATNAAQLSSTFQAIARQMMTLRLTK